MESLDLDGPDGVSFFVVPAVIWPTGLMPDLRTRPVTMPCCGISGW